MAISVMETRCEELNELKGWMHQLGADMQTAILGRISDIDNRIQNLSDRVSSLEMHNEAVLQQTDESITAASDYPPKSAPFTYPQSPH